MRVEYTTNNFEPLYGNQEDWGCLFLITNENGVPRSQFRAYKRHVSQQDTQKLICENSSVNLKNLKSANRAWTVMGDV